ncbi:peptidoglycan-associated lipoprotein [Cupriavidus metallidurans]|jgi:peptidoglycan-associated lipoprotein|uniref:Peptidoglycan-associated lipoprotein n=2 Tax=Cupriavidus metallidurans TaxID=119219 RepID=Q1LJX9_CUPMC|nr:MULTISPECIES: peptidoglycan-associated lipoprotein Pal [Cupriavidus]ABF09547.1 peptidoglycan-associated outer membrane lipoprotein [Cupriavidus metallidurans CH34]KWW37296.1 Outer membrane protein P6 [Cupriavidus metallidurans]MDE4919105.1 peptidoglycan-associated lipoprotein Pal [Cupriavidus metallidurans]QWC87843.1 peptidoglycan-associated lipoprotein Pal [Cupriavidus metallidurans]UBM10234.1 peptidoglycan-associated lipoprotein Pal [Cupriavidus metallidurans]
MSQMMTKSLAIAALLALGACSSGVKLDDASKSGAGTGATTDARNVAPVDVSRDPLNDPNGPLAKRSVYFDFDSYSVKQDYQGMLQAHSQYLGSNKSRKILIQGNTDERGTSEYNLALGQKRAEAVRRSLAAMGVPDSQMEAVSLGKEKPKATGHDDASWAENRRADIVY